MGGGFIKIWELKSNCNNYKILQFMNDIERKNFISNSYNQEKNSWFEGSSILNEWIRPELKSSGKGPLGDIINFHGGIMGINEKALNVLNAFFNNKIELLPIVCKENYYIVNVLHVLDCIDYVNSDYKCFSESDRIMSFDKYAFNETKIKNEDFFNIKEKPSGYSFVSENFVNAVLENNLKGFYFNLVYETGRDIRQDLRREVSLSLNPPIIT